MFNLFPRLAGLRSQRMGTWRQRQPACTAIATPAGAAKIAAEICRRSGGSELLLASPPPPPPPHAPAPAPFIPIKPHLQRSYNGGGNPLMVQFACCGMLRDWIRCTTASSELNGEQFHSGATFAICTPRVLQILAHSRNKGRSHHGALRNHSCSAQLHLHTHNKA